MNQATKDILRVMKSLTPMFIMGLILIGVLYFTTDIFDIIKVIEDDGDLVELPGDFPEFDSEDSTEGTRIVLYEGFTMTQPLTDKSIADISRIIQVEGNLESATLGFVASVSSENGVNDNRRHTIYFYINNGLSGGHVATSYSEGDPVTGFYTMSTSPWAEEFDLSELQISQYPDGPESYLDILSIMNDEEKHFIGSFVSTGAYGIIDKMWIDYECASDKCSVQLVR